MKSLIIKVFAVVMLLTNTQSYPQAMLIVDDCIQNYQQVSIVDKVYKIRTPYVDIDVIVPQLRGLESIDEQRYINNNIVINTEFNINEVVTIAKQYFENQVSPLMPYQLFTRYTVTNLESITSFYIDYYQFTGGAHGMTTRIAYNVDNSTGKELDLKDLFKEGYNYKSIIDNEIKKKIDKEPEKYFSGSDGFKGIKPNQSFYIKDNNLTIYFGLYEIAPYASGIPEFIIPLSSFNDNLISKNI